MDAMVLSKSMSWNSEKIKLKFLHLVKKRLMFLCSKIQKKTPRDSG